MGINPDRKEISLICVTLALSLTGFILVKSASAYHAMLYYGSSFYFSRKHLFSLLLGLAIMFFIYAFSDRKWLERAVVAAFPVALVLSVLTVFSGLGVTVKGATRWLEIAGFRFTTSETLKFSLLFFLAWLFSFREDSIRKGRPVLAAGVLFVLSAALLMKQPDFGTTAVMAFSVIVLMIYAGIRVSWMLLAAVPVIPVGIYFISSEPYRLERITGWLHYLENPKGAGYQILNSLYAIADGGLFGRGIGQSHQKLLYLPEKHTDFIFSIIGEELGYAGMVFIIVLFVMYLKFGVEIAVSCRDRFTALLAGAAVFTVSLQALLNIGVVSGLVPTTGMTLPFISYGGTSMVVNLAVTGIILACSRISGRGKA